MDNNKKTLISIFRITLVLTLIHGFYLFYTCGTEMFYMYYLNKFVFFQPDQVLLFSVPKEVILSFALSKVTDILFFPLLFFAYFLYDTEFFKPGKYSEINDDLFASFVIAHVFFVGFLLTVLGIAYNSSSIARTQVFLDLYILFINLISFFIYLFFKWFKGYGDKLLVLSSEQEHISGIIILTPGISLLFINFIVNGNSIILSLLVAITIIFIIFEFFTFATSMKSNIVFSLKKLTLFFNNFVKWILVMK